MSLQSDQDAPQVCFDDARARGEILERNRIREAAKLPALSVEEQLQRMRAVYDQKIYALATERGCRAETFGPDEKTRWRSRVVTYGLSLRRWSSLSRQSSEDNADVVSQPV
jgi:hypothetical protein